ncbi:MAG: proprotein convertase P-domain-containing protein, partial [Acidobacteriota bacterium]
ILLDAEGSWPNLVAGSSATSQAPLRFTIADDLCAQEVSLALQVNSDQGTFTIPITDTVGAEQAPDVPVAIPDGTLLPGESTLEIATDVAISGLEVAVDISHTWVGDLTISLESPAGTEITLLDRPGVPASADGCFNNGVRVTFTDSAATDPENFCNADSSDPWISGDVLPAAPLSGFGGEQSAGTWTLRVRDSLAGDLGSLIGWSLANAEPLGAECVACPAQSDLELTKICTDFPTLLCTLEVRNLGPSSALDVEVSDVIPPPLFWVSDDCAAGPPVADTLTWLVGALAPGESAVCLIDFDQPEDVTGVVTNVATATTSIPDPQAINDTAEADLTLGTLIDIPTLGFWGFVALIVLLAALSIALLGRLKEKAR